MASQFEQVANLLAQRAKVANALNTDQQILNRLPRTIERRQRELAQIDQHLAQLKSKVDGTSDSTQESKPAKK